MTRNAGEIGKVAVVTGANRGLGLEIARQLAMARHRVVITAREPARGQEAAAQLAAEG
ncbi:MAG: SDR family NAD(P)-dependent oxidoreductase, partial [Hyphomicrobiaceae bacterium]